MLQNIPHNTNDEAHELRGLFEKQLREIYWAEGAMVHLLGNSALQSSSKDLITLLEHHRIETLKHLSRLDEIFNAIGIQPDQLPYEAMECFIEEVGNTRNIRQGVVRDAAIIAVLQKIKHYEIASYGTMRAHTIALREEDVVSLLEQTLEEKKRADLALSHIAESHINIEAADKEI